MNDDADDVDDDDGDDNDDDCCLRTDEGLFWQLNVFATS